MSLGGGGWVLWSLLTDQFVANLTVGELALLTTIMGGLATATCHQLFVRGITKGAKAACSGLQITEDVRFFDIQFVSGFYASLHSFSCQKYGTGH